MKYRSRGEKLPEGEAKKLILEFLINNIDGAEERQIRDFLKDTARIHERKGVRLHLDRLEKDGFIVLKSRKGHENIWKPSSSYHAFKQIVKMFLDGNRKDKITFMTSKYLNTCLTEKLMALLTITYFFGVDDILKSMKKKYSKTYKKFYENWKLKDNSLTYYERANDALIGMLIDKGEKKLGRNVWTKLQMGVFSTILNLSPTALYALLFEASFNEVHDKVVNDYSMIPLIRSRWNIDLENPKKEIDKNKAVMFDALYTFMLTSLVSDVMKYPELINTKERHDDVRVLFSMPLRWDYTFYDKPRIGRRPKNDRSGISKTKKP